MIAEIIGLYDQIRKIAEEHLASDTGPFARFGDKYRVTEIEAYTLAAEYLPNQEAYNSLNPPEFLLGQLVMSFKVKALKLPLEYSKLPDEVEVTVDLVQEKLVVRKKVFTRQTSLGWVASEFGKGN